MLLIMIHVMLIIILRLILRLTRWYEVYRLCRWYEVYRLEVYGLVAVAAAVARRACASGC